MLSYIWKRLRSEERGFTLIELLIVILILGILAAIAIFASEPFRARAEAACVEANLRIGAVADAAIGAGVDPNLYWAPPGDCAVGGGTGGGPGGGGSSGLTGTFVAGQAGAGNLTVSAEAGELLVAITTHRTLVQAAHPGTASAAGYTSRGIAGFMSGDGDRRAIAVFTRIADGTAADNFEPVWTSPAASVNSVVQRFTVSSTPSSFTFVATNGDGTTVTSFPLSPAAGGTGSSLMVVGSTVRADSARTITWTGASNATAATDGNMRSSLASAAVSGDGPHGATATISLTSHTSGFVLIIR